MISRWAAYKEQALELRKEGVSMTVIEKQLGIPRSTLSGWFRAIKLTSNQKATLRQNSNEGRERGRAKATATHNQGKALRIQAAKDAALATLEKIELTDEVLDLALAMLYWGEGAKTDVTSLASSDPHILRFTIAVLQRNYKIAPEGLRCDLHLRMDQDGDTLKAYWSEQLNLPLTCFKYVAYDKRSAGKPTYDHYKGVCAITCNTIAIQRKLVFLYTLFCTRVTSSARILSSFG